VGLITVLGLGSPARAQEQLPALGMIGLAERQTAILNMVLVGPPAENHPGCRVIASFVDARGQVFRDDAGNAVAHSFSLQPQIASWLVLRSPDILAAGQLRQSIRAVLAPVPGAPSDCSCLVPSVEIVNPDGRTAAYLGGSDVGMRVPGGGNPPPPPGTCFARVKD
jgi:hypothetical protein